jgi:hypothetical protein
MNVVNGEVVAERPLFLLFSGSTGQLPLWCFVASGMQIEVKYF